MGIAPADLARGAFEVDRLVLIEAGLGIVGVLLFLAAYIAIGHFIVDQ